MLARSRTMLDKKKKMVVCVRAAIYHIILYSICLRCGKKNLCRNKTVLTETALLLLISSKLAKTDQHLIKYT